ncbi:3-hydroxyacyl-ACP dehydratase FabZ [Pseudothermotoga thermarum]|uniref:3-hydroxyacyl-[acyl-carrier-protein] dehydratase FabZ n=1 Tax=Pseudothermotoga thermarum DSM 5069 TaxID=688269 RepID=F7YY80_9THEM|nr:3-hydroxyacyl-ACP dehydratase FabZ [Pseudothermotoga thermarum]AEH50901.1 3-hydroxyacyl-(acyl-carrier-protein) dehydratase [Pseudothermotoga thermarum DSM 5069]
MNIDEILSILPHRFPFILVDRVLEKSENHIVAVKNVTANEIFFLGHFPRYPIYPGVLIIEGLAQAAGLMLLDPGKNFIPLFLGIDKARFKAEVRPGDVLKYEVKLKETRMGVYFVEGKATVDGKVVATATLMLGVKKQ